MAGNTNLRLFNQTGNGDYGDWAPSQAGLPQVQDASGTPGVDINLGVNELTALDVVGYNLVAVPEPGSATLLLGGLIFGGIILQSRRQVSLNKA